MSLPDKVRSILHTIVEPFKKGYLKVSSIHNIYWEVSGNPQGKPVVIIHGGPGGGSVPFYYGFFDPKVYCIVQFDQRGSGLSEPFASLEENTTWDLVADVEKIREHLSIEKWHTMFGGSWGSTLSLAYAQTYPERVGHLVLRGIFLARRSEIQFLQQEGANWLFPDYHEQLKNLLPEVQQGDIVHNYYLKLTGDNHEEQVKFAQAWTKWEMVTSNLFIDEESLLKGEEEKFAVAYARIEAHYLVNGAFLRTENQLLDDCHKIAHIPTVIVQGRYDVVCPVKSAWDLHKALKNSELVIVPDAGHSCTEAGIIHELVNATIKFSANP